MGTDLQAEERAELWRKACLQPPTAVSAGGFVLLLSLSLLADPDQQLMALLMALLLLTVCLNFWRLGRLRSLLRSEPSLVVTALSFHTAFDLISLGHRAGVGTVLGLRVLRGSLEQFLEGQPHPHR